MNNFNCLFYLKKNHSSSFIHPPTKQTLPPNKSGTVNVGLLIQIGKPQPIHNPVGNTVRNPVQIRNFFEHNTFAIEKQHSDNPFASTIWAASCRGRSMTVRHNMHFDFWFKDLVKQYGLVPILLHTIKLAVSAWKECEIIRRVCKTYRTIVTRSHHLSDSLWYFRRTYATLKLFCFCIVSILIV